MKHKEIYIILSFVLLYLCIPLCLPHTSHLFAAEDRPVHPSLRVLGGFTVGCVLSLLLPPGTARWILGAFLLLYVHKEYPKYTTGKPAEDYLVAINVVLTSFKFVDFVYLRVPEHAAHRVDADGKPTEDAKALRNPTYWRRLKWSGSLFATLRGIGWNWRVKNVEEVPRHTTKWAFILRQVLGFAYCYLAVDFLTYQLKLHPAVRSRSADEYFALPLLTQIRIAWMLAFRGGCEMSIGYYLVAAIAVATELSESRSWPPYFGSCAKAHTLRNLWGKFWHQNLRRNFETYSSLLCKKLGVQQGSLGSAYLKLYFSFLFSAYIHNAAAMNNPYTPAVKYQFWFFLVQPVAISIEDIVCFFGRSGLDYDRGSTDHRGAVTDNGKPNARHKTVGYLWVFCFLSYSLRYMAAYTCASGFAAVEHPLTKVFSVTRRVLAEGD